MTSLQLSAPDWRLATAPVSGAVARYWAPCASFVLHGAVLAALLWAISPTPVPPPATPLVILEFVAAPPQIASAAPQLERSVETLEPAVPPPAAAVEQVRPVVESPVAEDALPPPAVVAKQPEPKPAVEPKRAVKPKAAPAPQRAQPVEATSSDAPSLTDATAPAAPQQAVLPQPVVPVLAPPADAAPPADYAVALRQKLERNKVYPRAAQQRRQQGQAMLRIAIDRGGRVLTYQIEQSSGHEVLDREVIAMIQRASPLPPIPAALAADRLEVVVPVEFFLR